MGDPMHFIFAICKDGPVEAELVSRLYDCAAILAALRASKFAVHLKGRNSLVCT